MKNAISLTLLVPLLCSSEPEHDIQGQFACNKGYGTVYEGGLRLRAIMMCVHTVCTVGKISDSQPGGPGLKSRPGRRLKFR